LKDLLVNIDVDDLRRATAFYTEAFGLTVGRRLGEEVVELLGAPSPIYLLARPAGTIASVLSPDRRRYGRHWTPVHLDVVVDDIDTALARALAAGAGIETPVRTAVWGKIGVLSDPFGNGFCLIEFLGRGYDEIESSIKP
jgi:predicted enzyme related to lactoylglutathione lyase